MALTLPNDVILDWTPPPAEVFEDNQPFRLGIQAHDLIVDPNVNPRSIAWTRFLWLDQRNEGACTGFGAAHCLGIGPNFWPVTEADARLFYRWAQRNDYWTGEDYEGSSVHGSLKGLHKSGIIDGYWWCETLEELIYAVGFFGAVEMGSNWKTGMIRPDSDGMVRATGDDEGGHAYSIAAVDLRREIARIDNSWGKPWGINGSAFISFDDLSLLLAERGAECGLPRKKMYNHSIMVASRSLTGNEMVPGVS